MNNGIQPVMITVAPNGSRVRKSDHPGVPISPAEIAAEVVDCSRAGASIAHIHARAPDQSPSYSVEIFQEIIERTREHSDIALQLSLGTRGFTADQAVAPLVLNPEMVSLPLRIDPLDIAQARSTLHAMTAKVSASGAVPEMSIYDDEMLDTALELIESGLVTKPYCFGLVLANPVSFESGAQKMMSLVSRLPPGAHWWCAKGGRYQLELSALAISLGGHVRVGLEDSIFDFGSPNPAPDNAAMVRRIRDLCTALGRPVATAEQVRTMLASHFFAAEQVSSVSLKRTETL
ncbi:MAG TPA: 3-keto-5-aminohexanoate cleavage protein [Eoetvoesiella sp.]